jgi:hypothetical protein
MSVPVPDTTAEPEEVLQHEPPEVNTAVAVPVTVRGPVRVQQPPATRWNTGSARVTGDTPPVKLVDANPMRKRIVLMCDSIATIAESQAKAQMGFGGGGYFRPSVPLELTHQQEIWAWVTATEDSGSSIGWWEEFWTD